jgi:hypothetical protein
MDAQRYSRGHKSPASDSRRSPDPTVRGQAETTAGGHASGRAVSGRAVSGQTATQGTALTGALPAVQLRIQRSITPKRAMTSRIIRPVPGIGLLVKLLELSGGIDLLMISGLLQAACILRLPVSGRLLPVGDQNLLMLLSARVSRPMCLPSGQRKPTTPERSQIGGHFPAVKVLPAVKGCPAVKIPRGHVGVPGSGPLAHNALWHLSGHLITPGSVISLMVAIALGIDAVCPD